MPATVQTRLDLPVRKTRSGTPAKKVVTTDVTTPSKGKSQLIVPVEDPEKLLRTPRSSRKKNVPAKSPLKRNARDNTPDLGSVSPTKQVRTPAKTIQKENARPVDSPCSRLARLALASPRPPLGAPASRNNMLFSPPKMSVESIADLLDSPVKTKITPRKVLTPSRPSLVPTPTKSLFQSPRGLTSDQVEDILLSPYKKSISIKSPTPSSKNLFASPKKPTPRKTGRTPVPKSPRQSIVPTPTKILFPTKSPRKITTSQLEDLLCSPVKSPKPKLPTKSPRKPQTPVKFCSPVKRTALFSPAKSSPSVPPPALYHPDVSQYQSARAALHTGTPEYLMCREKQVTEMSSWLDNHLGMGKPGSMYVSGAPGTGKTATLTHLLGAKSFTYKSIFINCMVVKSSIAIYREVAKQLCPKKSPKTEKDALKVIENAITTSDSMTLLVLDEVDQLESKDQSVLYTVFEWPALKGSKLALVGIANSLDLTDRVLPRLQVKAAYKPTLLAYPPYTKQQIIDILTARLKEGAGENNPIPVITPRAIAFLASKISSLSGDLRKALDVCRRALELAETMARKQTLLKPMTPRGLASPAKSPHKGYKTAKPLPQLGQVDMPQIMKVINQVYGSQITQSLGTKGEGLPVQQKILIASLLLMVKKGQSKEVTLGKLIDSYTKVLKKRNMKPELESSCVGMIEMLESRGMVSYLCKGAPRMAKVSLRMDEDEVGQAFGDKAMLAGIVEDVNCIVR